MLEGEFDFDLGQLNGMTQWNEIPGVRLAAMTRICATAKSTLLFLWVPAAMWARVFGLHENVAACLYTAMGGRFVATSTMRAALLIEVGQFGHRASSMTRVSTGVEFSFEYRARAAGFKMSIKVRFSPS